MHLLYQVSIVVLNWNGAEDTLACLDSLQALTYPNFNVILVDNGSTDESLLRLRAYKAPYPLTLLETGRNLGYAEGNNVGIRLAMNRADEFVLVLNNDTTVAPDLLEQLLDATMHNPDIGVFGARILFMDQPEIVAFDGAKWDNIRLAFVYPGEGALEKNLSYDGGDTDYVCGAALFFRTEVTRQIGLLDSRFFLTWEESDWCFRARRSGYGCRIVPKAKIWHAVAVSFGGENSPLRVYFTMRNRLLWAERNLGLLSYCRVLFNTLTNSWPQFVIGQDDSPLVKRLFWAAQDQILAIVGTGNRFVYLAKRRAALDYLLRRFGNCPDSVRNWNRAWQSRANPA